MANRTPSPQDEHLTPSEVARLFKVDPKTVIRWAKTGRLPCTRTPGGHRRYRRVDAEALLSGQRLHVLALTDDQLAAAVDMLGEVLDRAWHGPLTDDEAAPLLVLLRALPGGESQ